ncbi:hypothetical protein GCM10012320_06030 [Sinomonas cellulolyticus]|uniref:DUF3311 domain-containing protein n=1 Tax=Sinomonas cellulolyticus TaxID=2801916 RepID=A0ABS1K2N0_9MICC|nr:MULTISPECIES: DUF3311 domain-containing protein [Sinomonas]MBL0705930.1 DUF3311 domain-containing protein [Sinomonas cellulolyticus]GHG42681.1 hypothetical protein GCM10012320_06030 [Sinomonas sp. KCTC 49339]
MSDSTLPTRDTPTRGPAKPLPYVVAGILLAVAIVLPLMPQLYSFDQPRWGGMPFFYWYQLVWVPISAALSGVAYWLVTGEDRRRRAAVRGARPAGGGGAGSSPGAGAPGGGGRHAASSDDTETPGEAEGGEAR